MRPFAPVSQEGLLAHIYTYGPAISGETGIFIIG